jgi:hypothetical protein
MKTFWGWFFVVDGLVALISAQVVLVLSARYFPGWGSLADLVLMTPFVVIDVGQILAGMILLNTRPLPRRYDPLEQLVAEAHQRENQFLSAWLGVLTAVVLVLVRFVIVARLVAAQ